MMETGAREDDEHAPEPGPVESGPVETGGRSPLPLAVLYAGPVKRSMTIAGHTTSISLEPVFWQALEEAARAAPLPLSALVARIDAQRITLADPPNLASAIRCWLFAQR